MHGQIRGQLGRVGSEEEESQGQTSRSKLTPRPWWLTIKLRYLEEKSQTSIVKIRVLFLNYAKLVPHAALTGKKVTTYKTKSNITSRPWRLGFTVQKVSN